MTGVYICICGWCIKSGGCLWPVRRLPWYCFPNHSGMLTGYVLSFWWLAVTGHAAEGILDSRFGMCCGAAFILIAVVQLAWLDPSIVAMITWDLETTLLCEAWRCWPLAESLQSGYRSILTVWMTPGMFHIHCFFQVPMKIQDFANLHLCMWSMGAWMVASSSAMLLIYQVHIIKVYVFVD